MSDKPSGAEPRRPSAETSQFILDWVKDIPEREAKDIEYLNSRVIQVFTGASVLIGLAGLSNTGLSASAGHTPAQSGIVTVLVFAALVAYLAVSAVTLWSIRHERVAGVRLAQELWQKFWMEDVPTIQHALIDAVGQASRANAKLLKRKGIATQVIVGLTVVEAMLVIAALATARLT